MALGIEPGEHVGILMPNCPEFIELLFGIVLAGGVAVTVNARYKAEELAYVAENADLKAVVTSSLASEYVDFAGLLQDALPGLADAPDPRALLLDSAPLLRFVTRIGADAPSGFLPYHAFRAAAAQRTRARRRPAPAVRCSPPTRAS